MMMGAFAHNFLARAAPRKLERVPLPRGQARDLSRSGFHDGVGPTHFAEVVFSPRL
jgi:hypothetical protein